ncbi:MAG: ABC transporter ATP-binding protein, partial [Acidimicrobiia bacterium]|nr:ABC transporter ATP-binding protein [Acidimicrobiia bacterium]
MTITDPTAGSGPGAPTSVPADGASVVLTEVSKSFGQLVAVSDIDLVIRPGITAILGPNGAGKSTLLRLICGLAKPSTGSVWVAGGDPRFDQEARSHIGLVPQQDGVFENQTALETVKLAATLSGLDQPEEQARRALDTVELDPELARPVGTFSKGMRQRVKVAQALVHDPSILVLDEPLNGLDPRQRRHMIELFRRLGEAGRTVLISSHVLDEVERFGSHIVVVAKGRLVAEGDFREIRTLLDNQPHRLRIQVKQARQVAAELLRLEAVVG